VQNPDKILAPFVLPSMTVMDVGSAMGFFSLSMAKLVGPSGRVICVDLQEKMLVTLRKRAQKAEVADRIESRICTADGLGIDDLSGQIDFALAFAVVHEAPQPKKLFEETRSALRQDGTLLFAEPSGHVKIDQFRKSLNLAREVGYETLAAPKVARSHTAILKKQ
jgi:ubiquinone/menaquinone biosynthesis C-methylase UbiE